jgi:phosphatidylethanolamine-binding protein (PEBP) family uncharacterized protein
MKNRNIWITTMVGSFLSVTTAFAADFDIKFSWCGSTPEFTLSNVPKGTTKLDLRMVDLDVPSYNHGGAVLEFKGQKKIDCGAFISQIWYPPDPPSGSHPYKWTVSAKDKDGKELASATAERKFPEF